MWVCNWKQWPAPRETPLAPVEKQSRNIWLTCTVEGVVTVRVVLSAKHWLNYSRSTVMSSVVTMETWG